MKKGVLVILTIGLILLSSIVFAEDYPAVNATSTTAVEQSSTTTTEAPTASGGGSSTYYGEKTVGETSTTDPYAKPTVIGYGQATPTEEELVDTGNFIKEEVKCVFTNSKKEQQCYSASVKPVVCAGTDSCLVTIAYPKDKKVTWKSTCGGYGYTVMDGNAETVEFNCLNSDSVKSTAVGYGQEIPPATTTKEGYIDKSNFISEEVKCVFTNSKKEQQCYAGAVCVGIESCLTTIFQPKGKQIIWKSTCGGLRYTIMDGNPETVEFNCLPSDSVKPAELVGHGFRYSYWQCYDGTESKSNDDSSCKPSELWQKYAAEFCNGHCKGEKCGVNSFSVSNECYWEHTATPVTTSPVEPTSSGEGVSTSTIEAKLTEVTTSAEKFSILPSQEAKIAIPIDEKTVICKDSCSLDGKCYPFGYRKAGRFCSDKGGFEAQMDYEAACDNNFECSSNVCVSSKCISTPLLEKMMNWLKGIFG